MTHEKRSEANLARVMPSTAKDPQGTLITKGFAAAGVAKTVGRTDSSHHTYSIDMSTCKDLH